MGNTLLSSGNKYLKRYDKKFYKSSSWLSKRKEILDRDNNECQMCKEKRRYSAAQVVHHILHYQDYPELALTDSNLISLCGVCHNIVHPEKIERMKNKNQKNRIVNEERW